MDHAAELFAERGYHPTSVADIVESLRVGKGVFYWYFSSKEELLAEILRESQQDLRRRQQQAIGDEPNPVVRIELGIRATIEWFLEHRKYFTLFQFAAIADAARHIKEAIVDGLIADQNPEMLAEAIVGACNQLTRTYVFDRHEPVDRTTEAAVSFCLHGIVGK